MKFYDLKAGDTIEFTYVSVHQIRTEMKLVIGNGFFDVNDQFYEYRTMSNVTRVEPVELPDPEIPTDGLVHKIGDVVKIIGNVPNWSEDPHRHYFDEGEEVEIERFSQYYGETVYVCRRVGGSLVQHVAPRFVL